MYKDTHQLGDSCHCRSREVYCNCTVVENLVWCAPANRHDSGCSVLLSSAEGSLTHSLAHSLTHSLTYSLAYSIAYSIAHSLTHSPTHSPVYSPTHSPIYSVAHPASHPLSHSLTGQAIVIETKRLELGQSVQAYGNLASRKHKQIMTIIKASRIANTKAMKT